MYGVAEFLTAANFDCIAYDIRAHGTRENEICSYGEKEKGELQLVINAATQQFGDLGNIGAFGEGLGAAITLQALPSLPEVRSVALLNSFSTLKDTVWEIITQRHGKALGFVFYLVGDQILSWRADFRFSSITPVASAAKTNIPALVACSEKDSEFDSEAAQKIYEAFASKEKVLYTPFLRPGSSDYPKDNDELFALIIEWFVHHNHPQAPEVLPHIRRVPLPHPK